MKKALNYKWVLLATLFFLAVGCYRHYIVTTPKPGNRPVVEPGDIPLPNTPSLILPVSLKQTRPGRPKLLRFNVIPNRTLYARETNTFKIPNEVMAHLDAKECLDEFDSADALQALRSYAKNNDKGDLLKYIETEDQLKRLVADHPQEAKRLIPNKSEWQRLNPSQYNAILGWVRNCVGLFFPVFEVSIDNPSEQNILVTDVRYNIYEINKGRGEGKAGPLIPTASYVHKLAVQKGSQSFPLNPGFNIPPKQNGSFELQIWNDVLETSVDLAINIEFVTNRGVIKTGDFNLVLHVVPK